MTTTYPDKRLANALQRREIIEQARVRYVQVMRAGRLRIGEDAGDVTAENVRDCRRYLEHATLALDAIETQLSEGRR